MTKKDMETYIDNQAIAEQLHERIQLIRGKMFSLQSIVIDGQPRGTQVVTGGKHEDLICDYLMLIDDYENLQAKCNTQCLKIEEVLKTLPEAEQKIMREHYINGESWDAVARIHNYSRRTVFYLRDSAMSILGIS